MKYLYLVLFVLVVLVFGSDSAFAEEIIPTDGAVISEEYLKDDIRLHKTPEEIDMEKKKIEESFLESDKEAMEYIERIRREKKENERKLDDAKSEGEWVENLDSQNFNSDTLLEEDISSNLNNQTTITEKKQNIKNDVDDNEYKNILSMIRGLFFVIALEFLLIGVLFYIVLTRKNVRQ